MLWWYRWFVRQSAPKEAAWAATTPADDIVYDLVSIQYHALKSGHTYGKYLEDAEGHDDVLAFIRMCQQEDAQRAVTCHQLLTQLTKDGGIG